MFERILDNLTPYDVSTARDDGIRSHAKRLVGKNRGVNASHDHRRALLLGLAQDAITRKTIAAADADADDVVRTQVVRIELLDGFVNEDWIAYQPHRSGLSQH